MWRKMETETEVKNQWSAVQYAEEKTNLEENIYFWIQHHCYLVG